MPALNLSLNSCLNANLNAGLQSGLKTGLRASVAAIASVVVLGDRPAQASNYGPLPLLSADQIDENSTCYLKDESGLVVDLSWLCDGGQGTILPAVSVTKPYRKIAKAKLPFEPQLSKSKLAKSRTKLKVISVPVVAKPTCGASIEFSDGGSCQPPTIEITGGQALEAIQELSAPPSNPYENIGL